MQKKKTLVIGGSENPERYSNMAIKLLRDFNHDVVSIGQKEGEVDDVKIITQVENFQNIDTVTLYINPSIQTKYHDYILSLHPKRIIFNPGTENPSLVALATQHGIQTENACTLVLLKTGQY